MDSEYNGFRKLGSDLAVLANLLGCCEYLSTVYQNFELYQNDLDTVCNVILQVTNKLQVKLKAWNDIPANIREIKTLGCLKKELKAHLTS